MFVTKYNLEKFFVAFVFSFFVSHFNKCTGFKVLIVVHGYILCIFLVKFHSGKNSCLSLEKCFIKQA